MAAAPWLISLKSGRLKLRAAEEEDVSLEAQVNIVAWKMAVNITRGYLVPGVIDFKHRIVAMTATSWTMKSIETMRCRRKDPKEALTSSQMQAARDIRMTMT